MNTFLQAKKGVDAIPDLGIRISVWFIGMFLLAVVGVLIYLRMKELQDQRKSHNSSNT